MNGYLIIWLFQRIWIIFLIDKKLRLKTLQETGKMLSWNLMFILINLADYSVNFFEVFTFN